MRISDRDGGDAVDFSYWELFLIPDDIHHLREGQIYYDAARGRWIGVQRSGDCKPGGGAQYGHGYLDFAVSDTSNPLLGWTAYYYTYNDAFLINPRFGSSADKFVLTSGFRSIGPSCVAFGPTTWDVTAMGWRDVLSGAEIPAAYFDFPETSDGSVQGLFPAVAEGQAGDAVHILGQIYEVAAAQERTWDLIVTGSAPAANLQIHDLTFQEIVPAFGDPVTDGNGFTPDWGPTSVVVSKNRLVAVSSETCTPSGDATPRNCVRVLELDTATATPSRRQDFYVATNGKDVYSPGVGISESDDLVITYQQSSTGVGPAAYVARQAVSDASATVSESVVLQAPSDLYPSILGPADMIGLSPDPLVPDAVWVINQAGGSADGYRYFHFRAAQARTATGDTYEPITPLRILDSRDGTGLSGTFKANIPRTFNVAGAGGGSIPANAVAITANVTVVNHTAAGYVALTPSPTANPTSSTINVPLGDIRANNVTIPLSSDGDLSAVYKALAGKTAHVILDVTGYFLADDSGATYQPLTSARILDSRSGKGTGLTGRFRANTPRSFQVRDRGGVPATAIAVTGNLTVTNQTKAGFVALTPDQDATPDTSTLNFPLGDNRANGLTVPLAADGTLAAVYMATGGATADLIFDVTGYYLEGTSGLRFYPLNPGRIMDTRFNTLTQLFGQFTSSSPRTLVTGGHFGVPGDALAVTGNLTVVGQTAAGYVAITKSQIATPPVSTLNFPLGDVRANGVTVPLNAANDMALVYKASSGAKTNLVLDLTGYFK